MSSLITAYHGTKTDFTEFKTPAWFTPKREFADMFSADWGDGERTSDSKVIAVELSLKNPIHTTDWDVTEPDKAMLKKFKAWEKKGHDGVIFTSDEGEIEYIAFNPDQIKIVEVIDSSRPATRPRQA